VVSADDKVIIGLLLSGGECHDAPQGRKLLETMGKSETSLPLLMDKAYEGDETRAVAERMGYLPIVPPKSNRKTPWACDQELYKRRNVVERLFRRIKEFRRVFTRYDKLDVIYLAFVYFAFSAIWLR
jgi:transposase